MRPTEKEIQVIKEAMDKEKNARVYKRYLSLYLYQSGKKHREITEIVGLTKQTICNINRQYKQEGLAGIPDKLHAGRPPRLTEEQEAEIKKMVLNNITKMFKRLELTYTRPTYVLAKADKQKQEQFVEDFKEVKKTAGWRNPAYPF